MLVVVNSIERGDPLIFEEKFLSPPLMLQNSTEERGTDLIDEALALGCFFARIETGKKKNRNRRRR